MFKLIMCTAFVNGANGAIDESEQWDDGNFIE